VKEETALVTGASGFIGRHVVKVLHDKGLKVKAGVYHPLQQNIFNELRNVEIVPLNILNCDSLNNAMLKVDYVYHFAALVASHESRKNLQKINVEGTRNVWECASNNNIKAALYCSSTAVYGMLSKSFQPVNETVKARAIEPYGYSKLLGEIEVLKIAGNKNLPTIIIRPAAVFGPDEHTPFGKKLREAAVSKILLAGNLQKRKFNFVHVDDIAEAAVYLMQDIKNFGEIFNITVNNPILYEDAFQSYLNILDHADNMNLKTKAIAFFSSILNKVPSVPKFIYNSKIKDYFFTIWQPGFEILYSSEKLLKTSYKFRWESFEDVLQSCLKKL
jgi:nucleoside-diphosphate-sugar epimerase